ncbi:Ig-like domain-containing protein, partial [Limnohabitans sp.]|uniref:Ig-like domain-containing protein n=1 Tax=Limnohabitans sp. TaxID=1907725 RepID=UPI00286EE54B
ATVPAANLPTSGNVTFTITSTDAAGNVATQTRTASVDTTGPALAVTQTTANIAGDGTINAAERTAGVALSGTTDPGRSVSIATGTGANITAAADASGVWNATVPAASLPTSGSVTFTVSSSDAAGNTSSVTRTANVDTTGPALSVTQATANIAGDGTINAAERTAGVALSGTTDPGRSVSIATGTGSTVTVTADASGNWSTTIPEASLPTSGSVTFTVTSTDAAGNVATQTCTASVDTTGPTIAPSLALASDTGGSANDGITNNRTVNVGGVDAGNTWQYKIGTGEWANGSGSSFNLSADDASYDVGRIQVRQNDVAGNVGTVSSNAAIWIVDTAVPALLIDSKEGQALITLSESATGVVLSGSTEAGASVTIATGTGSDVTVSANSSGAWTATVPATSLPTGGSVTFSVTTVDAAGNTSSLTQAAQLDAFTQFVLSCKSSLVQQACRSQLEALDYQGLLNFFQKVNTDLKGRESGLTQLEFDDLKQLTQYVGQQLGTKTYLHSICNSFVNGDKFNTIWTEGGSQEIALGNLAVGSNATQFDQLVRTWFLGQNNPVERQGYEQDNDPLWEGGGPQVYEVRQGSYHNCTSVSAMAALCAEDQDLLKSMFTDNGNGTYGVRVGGDYYTFDNRFSTRGASRDAGTIWARLLEEAWYAFTYDNITFPSRAYEEKSYNIEPYSGAAMLYLTATTRVKSAWDVHVSKNVYSTEFGLPKLRQVLSSALEAGDFVSFGSGAKTGGRVAGHQYAVLAYDTSTDIVTLFNPWGYTERYTISNMFTHAYADNLIIVDNPMSAALPRHLALTLAEDTGTSAADGITQNRTLNVSGLTADVHWQYSTDGRMSWQEGSGTSIELKDGVYGAQHIVVRTLSSSGGVTDMAGNSAPLAVDNVAFTPLLAMVDAGISNSDRLTNQATIRIERLEKSATWQYKVDDGQWQAGTGSSFTATQGAHSYTTRQFDVAGNTSKTASLSMTLDTTAPANLSMILSSSSGNHGTLQVGGLLEPDLRIDYSMDYGASWATLSEDGSGPLRIDLPVLTSAANQIDNGDFRAGKMAWESDYGNATITETLPGALLNYPTNLSLAQGGAGDACLRVGKLDFGAFSRDIWRQKVEFSEGSTYTLDGYLAAGVTTSNISSVRYAVFVDGVSLGTDRVSVKGWQSFSKTMTAQNDGEHTISIRAFTPTPYFDSLFALDGLTFKNQTAIYDRGAVQIKATDEAGNSVISQNSSPIDWTLLNTNLVVI